MRTMTLGIALSALVGSFALAQSGTGNGTGSTTPNGNSPTKSTNDQATTPSKGTNSKKSQSASPTTAGDPSTSGASNSTSNVAKVSGHTIAQTVSENENLDILESLLGQAGLNGTFSGNGSYTLFAPTDSAFELLGTETLSNLSKPESKAKLNAILTYHVVPGSMTSTDFMKAGNANTLNGQRLGFAGSNGHYTVGTVTITQSDLKCSNGTIHVIDAVLMPTESNLAEVASTNGHFNTFLKACKAAGLDATLAKNGSYTVFAPTDEAFAKLPDGMLEMLFRPENRLQLREILSYHLVPGTRYYSNDLGGRSEIPTSLGETLSVHSNGGTVTLANGSVVTSDMQASNGVIHGVDTVLLPGVSTTSATVKGKGKPANGATATGQEKDSN